VTCIDVTVHAVLQGDTLEVLHADWHVGN
jgi:hypothetical protein